jgi:hypothetical protein
VDPNEALAEIRLLCAKDQATGESLDPHEVEQLVEMFQALDQWLVTGGFLPREWAV